LTDAVETDDIGREIYGFEKDEPLTFTRVQSRFLPDDLEEVLRHAAALAPKGVAKPVEPVEIITAAANLAGRMRNPKQNESE